MTKQDYAVGEVGLCWNYSLLHDLEVFGCGLWKEFGKVWRCQLEKSCNAVNQILMKDSSWISEDQKTNKNTDEKDQDREISTENKTPLAVGLQIICVMLKF